MATPKIASASKEERVINASTFKERCLALLDQVAMTKEPITVTKRGKPVARIVPIDTAPPISLFGSGTLLSDDDEDYFSTGVRWPQEDEDWQP